MGEVQLHVRVPDSLAAWIKTRAEIERRSVNTYILLVLEAWKKSKERPDG